MKRYEENRYAIKQFIRPFLTPHDNGEWVRFDDVAPLIEALRECVRLATFTTGADYVDLAVEKIARAALEKAGVKL